MGGYLSKSLDLKFSDIPGGALDSWAAVPAIGWFQIVSTIIFLELAYGATDPNKEPGDVGGITWIRYDDPEVKKFKLNAAQQRPRRDDGHHGHDHSQPAWCRFALPDCVVNARTHLQNSLCVA